MYKPLLREQQPLLTRLRASRKQLSRLLGAGVLLLSGLSAQAQTTVFNETFEGATPSFTIANTAQTNQWYVGTVAGNGPTTTGTKAAFVSNDLGVTNAYTLTSLSVAHLYRDVTFPAGQNIIQLGFDWLAGGESTYDYIQVFVVPTTVTPVAGTQLVTGTAGAVQFGGNINLQTAFGRTSFQLPASYAGTTQRLVFTWRNDGSLGAQPPAVLDNISVTSAVANPISGAYTINSALPTAGTNFHSFTDAASRLNLDGISGPTTLTVSGGPYTEQFLLNDIAGTSATNTVVVNGGGRTIQYASASSTQRAVVQLNGTDYTTINNLNIDATGGSGTSGTYGYGVLLTNAADNDRITNNTINADIATTSSNFAGIAVNGSTASTTTAGNSANNLLIEGNTVIGGYYGITLYGNTATALNTGNIVRNNTVRDFYLYGLYVGYQDGAQLIGNDVNRALRTASSTFYGLYLTGSSRGMAVEKNRIHDPFTGTPTSTSTAYGMYIITGTGATATATNDFVNNALYNFNGAGGLYGIYNTGAAFSRIYNNSLSFSDQTSASTSTVYGIYNTGTSVEVKNNIVNITRTGTGTKYGLYYTVAGTLSNNNDIYAPTGNVGYYTAAQLTLANWQAANSAAFDQNSVSADPVFVNEATGNLTPANVQLNNIGTPLARVTTDITGATRGAAPDLGAYEFTPVAVDVAPVALVGPATGTSCFSTAEPVIVQIRNGGTSALNFATNPATVSVVVTLPGGTTQIFPATVSTGTLASGATQNVTLTGTLNMATLGTYAFAVTATVTGDANTGNNVLTPAPTRTVVAPVAGVLSPNAVSICVSGTATLNLAGAANGNTQFQSSPNNTTWTDIAGATSAAYTTPVLTSTTYYRVRSTCNTNIVYSNVATLTVNNPVISAAPTPLSTCAGGTATLSATTPTGVSVRYFTAATGGTAVGTGSPFVTPVLTAGTTYYAEAFAGGTENVGPTLFNSTGQTPQTGGALYFTTTGPTTIASVTVFLNAGQAAGTVTIDLRTGSSSAGAVVNSQSRAFAVPAGPATGVAPYVVPLNYSVPAAGQYTLYLPSATQSGLLRDSGGSNTTSYPYTSPSGAVTITASSLSTYYYYFYNLVIGGECVGASRTPIVVNVTPGLVASLPVAAAASCGRTPYQLAGTIAGSATGATYTSSGTGVFSPNATTLNATYTPSAADVTAGTVTLTLTPTGPTAPCTSVGQVVLTLATPPNGAFSYPVGIYCTGSPTTVAPVLAAGSVAGTFSTTGIGLRIDPVTGVIDLARSISDGTYTVINTVSATGICNGTTYSTTITLQFGILVPTLSAVANPGGGVTLTSSTLAGATYQFFLNGVAIAPAGSSNTLTLPTGALSGSYTVKVTASTGCSATSVASVVTATTASRNGLSLLVYPNPTTDGQLTIELQGLTAKASPLTVLNSLGQAVYHGTAAAGTATLDLGKLAAGVYTVQVQTAAGVLTQRVVRN